MEKRNVRIRPARITDAVAIKRLIDDSAAKDEVLPRSLQDVYSRIREFYVVDHEQDGIVGCVALKIFWEDLAEVRTLVVAPGLQEFGYGRRLTQAALEEARRLGIARVFALTNVAGFFKKLGFAEIPKEQLPLKVWTDCIHCPKFYHCDEVAVLFHCEQLVPDGALAREEKNGLQS